MTYLPATSADFVSNATTSSKESVTGVTAPCPASRVVQFEFRGRVTVAATTTGVAFGLDVPASAVIVGQCEITISGTLGTDAVTVGAITADDTFNLPADVMDADDPGNFFVVKGIVANSTTAGEIQLRVDTEAAAAATVKKGVTRWYQDCCAA